MKSWECHGYIGCGRGSQRRGAGEAKNPSATDYQRSGSATATATDYTPVPLPLPPPLPPIIPPPSADACLEKIAEFVRFNC
ncbi:MAG: hypothetical protein GY820_17135 [Gammaproteobacteria bacterium]|nr:hypothetical protein [Gammaproteobacteria bacterium]